MHGRNTEFLRDHFEVLLPTLRVDAVEKLEKSKTPKIRAKCVVISKRGSLPP
jgi:hypothetical protein